MNLNILLIGSGGREHALAVALERSRSCAKLYANPGNPGIFKISEYADIEIDDHESVVNFCENNKIDLVVIGPEQPLAVGLSDSLRNEGINVFGPSLNAAQLESSKGFAKDFMDKYDIPTAAYARFTKEDENKAHDYINTQKLPVVIKADGLAAGKGVVIAESYIDAHSTLDEMFDGRFGNASSNVVIEEFMDGAEASVFAVCDGKDFVTLASSQDHKRAYDGDKGPNTGGMGAYSPATIVTDEILKKVHEDVIDPTLKGMKELGMPFIGCLYCGLMIKNDSVKVVEFNVRFGDPETQAVLSIFEGDLAKLFWSAATGSIDKSSVVSVSNGYACNVVIASQGYPNSYEKGFVITGIEDAEEEGALVYHAGTKSDDGMIVTNGGRVLGVTGVSETDIETAVINAYDGVNQIQFENKFYRKDIAFRALKKA